MQTHTSTATRPDELKISLDGNMIIGASRTVSEEREDGSFLNTVTSMGNISVPATKDEATRLLMACKYPRADKECVILRKAADDPEKVEHEAYYQRVSEYVESLGLA